MITGLKGKVFQCRDRWVVLDVGGVFYALECSSMTCAMCLEGQEVFIRSHVRCVDESLKLYGFHNEEELDWFHVVTSVSGVGASLALSLLSVWTPKNLAGIVHSGDESALRRVSGIGARLAVRIVTELKGHSILKGYDPASLSSSSCEDKELKDQSCQALVNLGYRLEDVIKIYDQVIGSCAAEEKQPSLDILIMRMLRYADVR